MRRENVPAGASKATLARTRDIEIIDTELRFMATLRRLVREGGGRLPSLVAVDALLDERLRTSGRLRPPSSARAPQAVEA